MNSQLFRALTSYNDRAQLNQGRITDLKKSMYDKQIRAFSHVQNTTVANFTLKPINYSFLNSVFLNDNPHFKEIKAAFASYNSQISKLNQVFVDDRHLRPQLMDSLLKFMRLVMLTPDRTAQTNMLGQIVAWYRQMTTTRQHKSKFQLEFQKELQARLQKARLAAKQSNPNLPSEKIIVEKRPYMRNFRTLHSDYQVPGERLKGKKRRGNFEQIQIKHTSLPPVNRVKYQRPPPLVFHKDIPEAKTQEIAKDKPFESVHAANLSTQESDPHASVAPVDPADPSRPPGQPLPVAAPETGQELLLGVQDEGGDQDEQLQPEPQVEQEGKLDPRVKNYLFPASNYKNIAQVRMNQRVLKMNQQMDRRTREDQANYYIKKQWSKQRVRLQSQITRKIQSVRQFASLHANRPDQNKTLPTPNLIVIDKQEKVSKPTFQQTIDNIKLQEVKHFGLKQMNYQKPDQQVNHITGLSVFDRRRVKTEYKDLSQIINQHSKQKEREHSMQQIEQIKNRFAKYKLPVQIKLISDGLLHPKDIPAQRLQNINSAEVSLPSNPFMKVSKKKKKGKKK